MKLNDFEKRWLTQAVAEAEITNSNLLEIGFETEVDYESDKLEELVVEQGIKIAEKEGFIKILDTWMTRTRTLGLFSIVLIFMIGFVSAFNFHESSNTREINALLSILIILTPNIVMMLLWFFGFLIQARRPIGIAHFWEWLISHIPGAHKQLVGSFLKLHDQGNLTRWWLGCITHRFWTFITLGVLGGLASALAFRGYEFVWESTWLTDETFIIIINTLGIIPSYLGFTVPENPVYILSSYANELKSSGVAEIDNYTNLENRRAWTFWLLGCIFVYGLVPRIFLWSLCSAKYKYSRNKIKLELGNNEYKHFILALSTVNKDKKTVENSEQVNNVLIDKLIDPKKEKTFYKTNYRYNKKTDSYKFINYIDSDSTPRLLFYYRCIEYLLEKKNTNPSDKIILFIYSIPLWLNIQSKNKRDIKLTSRAIAKICLWFFHITRNDFIFFIITIPLMYYSSMTVLIYVLYVFLIKILICILLEIILPVFIK